MRMGARTIAVCAIACFHASPGAAQRTLTLPEALARAREQAPQIVSARLTMDEVRARLLGASLRFQENPEISAAIGKPMTAPMARPVLRPAIRSGLAQVTESWRCGLRARAGEGLTSRW